MARYAYFLCSAEFLVALCKRLGPQTCRLIDHAFPDDAKIIRMGHDSFGRLIIILESQGFAELADGDEIPRLPDPVFECIYP